MKKYLKVNSVRVAGLNTFTVTDIGINYVNTFVIQGFSKHPRGEGIWTIEFGHFEDNYMYVRESEELLKEIGEM